MPHHRDDDEEGLSGLEKIIASGKYHLPRDYSGEPLTFQLLAQGVLKALAGQPIILEKFTLLDVVFMLCYATTEDLDKVVAILGGSKSKWNRRIKFIKEALGIRARSPRKK